jgi:hypothetical protein
MSDALHENKAPRAARQGQTLAGRARKSIIFAYLHVKRKSRDEARSNAPLNSRGIQTNAR